MALDEKGMKALKQKITKLIANRIFVEPDIYDATELALAQKIELNNFCLGLADNLGLKRWSTWFKKNGKDFDAEYQSKVKALDVIYDKPYTAKKLNAFKIALDEYKKEIVDVSELDYGIAMHVLSAYRKVPISERMEMFNELVPKDDIHEFLTIFWDDLGAIAIEDSKFGVELYSALYETNEFSGKLNKNQIENIYDDLESSLEFYDQRVFLSLFKAVEPKLENISAEFLDLQVFNAEFYRLRFDGDTYPNYLEELIPYKDKFKLNKQVAHTFVNSVLDTCIDYYGDDTDKRRRSKDCSKLIDLLDKFGFEDAQIKNAIESYAFDERIENNPHVILQLAEKYPGIKFEFFDVPITPKIKKLILSDACKEVEFNVHPLESSALEM